MDASEAALVAAAKAGDQEAWAALYREHHGTVLRFLGYRLPALAEDYAAQVWVRAMGAIRGYEYTGTPFAAWLVTIARNLVNDHAKSAYAKREQPFFELPEVVDPDPELHEVAYARGRSREVVAAVRAGVARLTKTQAAAVRCRYLLGMSAVDTAKRLGSTEAAVKQAASRGMRALAEMPELAALARAA